MTAFVISGAALAASTATSAKPQSGQQIVDGAERTVRQIEADSRYDAILKQAKGVFIMPEVVKGAFIVGAEGAQGVLLRHDAQGSSAKGSWSQPVFLTMGSISLGAQAGGKNGPVAMMLMTDKAVSDFTQANNFSLNGKAGLTVVDYSADGQAPIGKGDVIVWSNQKGAFAGVDIGGADVMQDTSRDHSYYGKPVDAQQILAGQASNAAADRLVNALPG